MFGHEYAVKDQKLARGEMDRATYATELLMELLDRAVMFRALMSDHTDPLRAQDGALTTTACEIFERDVCEICARGGRAGLFTPHDDGLATMDLPDKRDLEDFGGALVKGGE